MSVPPPVEPVERDACPHCWGTGLVTEDCYMPGWGAYAAEGPCRACEGFTDALVDADGLCTCDECIVEPRSRRAGSASLPDSDPDSIAALTAAAERTPR